MRATPEIEAIRARRVSRDQGQHRRESIKAMIEMTPDFGVSSTEKARAEWSLHENARLERLLDEMKIHAPELVNAVVV